MRLSKSGAAVLFLCTLTAPVSLRGDPGERVAVPGPRDLILRLDAGKRSFVLYEPVTLVYEVRNPTPGAIKAAVDMMFESQTLKLTIQRPDGSSVPFFSGVAACKQPPPVEPPPFAAGQSLMEQTVMFWNDQKLDLAFPTTGRYAISGRMFVAFDAAGDAIQVEAEPVVLEVGEPGDVDRKVINSLGSPERLVDLLRYGAGRFCGDGDDAVGCHDDLRILLRRYPSSAYVPYIVFDLADTLTWSWRKHKNADLAVSLYADFLRRWPGHSLAAAAIRSGAFALKDAGRQEEAVEWMERFEKEFPRRHRELSDIRRYILGS